MAINTLLAKGNGELLINHLVETANKCKEYALSIGLEERLVKACYYSGLFHDIAKATPANQAILKKNKKEAVIHSYNAGLFLKTVLVVSAGTNGDCKHFKEAIYKSIGYHHAKAKDNTLLKESDFKAIQNVANFVLTNYPYSTNDEFVALDNSSSFSDFRDEEDYSYLSKNRETSPLICIVNNILKASDIYTSSKGTGLVVSTKQSVNFDKLQPAGLTEDRLNQQKKIANAIVCDKDNIISAFCSFGKTIVGYLYALKSECKTFWVLPKNGIALSVYKNLLKTNQQFGNPLSIGFYTANESYHFNPDGSVDNEFSWNYDIIVTNIDNYWSPVFKTSANSRCISILDRNCIFDEYHNYFGGNNGMFAMFYTLVQARKLCQSSASIFLSGTPYVSTVFGHKNLAGGYTDILESLAIDTFKDNDKLVNICKTDKEYEQKDICMYYNNSVRKVQQLTEEKNLFCVHSKFIPDDKARMLNTLLDSNGEFSTKAPMSVSASSIIAEGVNVSFNNIWLNRADWSIFYQCIGRGARFEEGNNQKTIPNIYVNQTALTSLTKEKDLKSEYFALKTQYACENLATEKWKSLYERWSNVLNNIPDGEIRLSKLYSYREQFIKDNKVTFDEMFDSLLTNSFEYYATLEYNKSSKKSSGSKFATTINSPRSDGEYATVFAQLVEGDMNSIIGLSRQDFEKFNSNGISNKMPDVRDYKKQHSDLYSDEYKNVLPLFLYPNTYSYSSKTGLNILIKKEF